jgi:hypothetical protein
MHNMDGRFAVFFAKP